MLFQILFYLTTNLITLFFILLGRNCNSTQLSLGFVIPIVDLFSLIS